MKAADRDLRAMRRLIAEGAEDHRDPELMLPMAAVDGLRSLLGCHAVSIGILDSTNQIATPWQDMPAPNSADLAGDVDSAEDVQVFFQHYWRDGECSYPDRTGDIESVIRISDFYSIRQYHSTAMWTEYVSGTGMGHDMMACLAGASGRTLRVLVWRDPPKDFTEREKDILWLLRPHLLGLYRQRQGPRPGAAALTPRQRQLLRHVAAGQTDRQIARQLGIAESTVRKHLQHAYERLQVNNRAAAVMRAFPADDLPPQAGPATG
jgi:DNA-binding CsgD family transcriptional regulator